MRFRFLLGVALTAPVGAEVVASLDVSGESLSRAGSSTWFDGSAGVRWYDGVRELGGGWREVRRYGTRDAEGSLSAGWKFGNVRLFGTGTLGVSSLFLPEHSVLGGIEGQLGAGLVGTLQWKQSQYSLLDAGNGLALLELYRGAWHGAAGAEWVLVTGGPQGFGWRAVADRSWSDRSGAGVTFGQSSEYERVGAQIRETRVTGGTLFLRQDVSPRILLRGNLAWADQGGLYHRIGGGIGLEFRMGK